MAQSNMMLYAGVFFFVIVLMMSLSWAYVKGYTHGYPKHVSKAIGDKYETCEEWDEGADAALEDTGYKQYWEETMDTFADYYDSLEEDELTTKLSESRAKVCK